MAWLELLLALVAIGATVLALWRSLALDQGIRDVADAMQRSGTLLIERQNASRARQQLSGAQQIAETVIDAGTSAVRAVHFGIAQIPFGILEALPPTRDATRVVRQTHDVIANAVYGSIRGANRIAGLLARNALTAAQRPNASTQLSTDVSAGDPRPEADSGSGPDAISHVRSDPR